MCQSKAQGGKRCSGRSGSAGGTCDVMEREPVDQYEEDEMTEAKKVDAQRAKCPICKGKGSIKCPEHNVNVDDEGWCLRCDSLNPKPQPVICQCQN
jgi:hypothetical protein